MRTGSAVLLALAAGAVALSAQGRVERGIVTNGEGPRRLAVDLPLLSRAAPFGSVRRVLTSDTERWRAFDGLSDLRLVDGSGREIPSLLVYPPAAEPWVQAAILPVAPVETATKKTSGFEADLGALHQVDMIRIEGLPSPFLKRFTMEASGDRAHWTLLDAEATLFDLPQERLRQVAVPFRGGMYRYLRVTWDDTHSGRVPLPDAVTARRAEAAPPPPPATAMLNVERRPSEPGRSRYRIRLPHRRLPIVALKLDVGGGHVYRTAVVTESRISGTQVEPAVIGRATITRLTRGEATASQLRIPIAVPHEPEIVLVIEDGDNPPLDLRGVSAEFAELPWIYFEAPAGAVKALYGDPAAKAPSYDLEAARATIRIAEVPTAAWMEPRESTTALTTAAPVHAPAPGAPLDASTFRVQRALPDGPAGLVALTVDAAMLADSTGPGTRFGDVRILDAAGRQVPYIVERREDPLVHDLELRPFDAKASELKSEPGRNRSVYAVTLPHANVPSMQLVMETNSRLFVRTINVGVERPPDRRRRDEWFDRFAAAPWQHTDASQPAPPLTLNLDSRPERDLLIVVDEGDNAPLAIAKARLLLPSYRLRFYRPAGALRVVYGRKDLIEPQYDLALLSSQVMGAEPLDVVALPADSRPATTAEQLVPARYFWIGLGAAVLVILGIIARLVRNPS